VLNDIFQLGKERRRSTHTKTHTDTVKCANRALQRPNLWAYPEGRVSLSRRFNSCMRPENGYISAVAKDTLITERVLRVGPPGARSFLLQA
jgi:hypothetical protein